MKRRKICYIYTDWAHRPDHRYGGVGYYRAVKPAEALRKWYDVDVFGEDLRTLGKDNREIWQHVFTKYDCVVIKQVDNEIGAGVLAFFSEYYGKPILLDVDDNYVEVRPDQPAYEVYHKGSQKRAIFHALLASVRGLMTSTKPLADFYAKRVKDIYGKELPTFVAPNCTDPKDWPEPKRPRRHVIGYAGSITHNSDLRLVIPSLAKLMRNRPDWHLEILGSVKGEDIPELFGEFDEITYRRVHIKGGTQSWKGYPELLRDQRWNVGLAPLVDDEFNRGKSHIKWMEYAMCGIPTLASRVYPYSEPIGGVPTVEDGKTGMLFSNAEEFEHKLCSLMENGKMRDEMAREATGAVKENWTYERHSGEWHEAIEAICNSPTPPTSLGSSKSAKG